MKTSRLMRVATALAIAGASAVLVGCGSKGNDQVPINPIVNGTGGIIPGTTPLPGGGACVPITQAIPFQAQGIYFSYQSIVGGFVPSGQQVGQVVVGGAGGGGPFQRDAVDMMISMNVLPAQMGYGGQIPGYPGGIPNQYQNPQYGFPSGYNQYSGFGQSPGTANATGVIQIKPNTIQQIMMQFGGMGGYPGQIPGQYGGQIPGQYPGGYGGYGQQVPCVSGIAFNLGNYNGTLFGGFVWLYLNGTQHGVYYPI